MYPSGRSFSHPCKVSMCTLFLPSTILWRQYFEGVNQVELLHLKVFSEHATALIASWGQNTLWATKLSKLLCNISLFWWYYRSRGLLIGLRSFWWQVSPLHSLVLLSIVAASPQKATLVKIIFNVFMHVQWTLFTIIWNIFQLISWILGD